MKGLTMWFLMGSIACVTQVDGTPKETGGGSDSGEIEDTSNTHTGDTDIFGDTGCDEEGDPGELHTAGDPSITAYMGTISIEANTGNYSARDCVTTIMAVAGSASVSQTLTITLDGLAQYASSFPVLSVRLVSQEAQGGDLYNYTADDTSGLTLDVSGFTEGGAMFAELSDAVEMTDSVGGESGTMVSITVESWPVW